MRTLLEVVRLSTAYLGRRGSSSARLDAELLAAHALGIQRLDVYLQHDRPLGDGELAAVRELVRRRGRGAPVAHLLGVREFHGRPFAVSPAVLIPRPDTETLVDTVLRWARARAGGDGEGLRLADLGTGSGCIACTLAAELPGATIVATDVSAEALEVAGENARRLGVAARVRLLQGSWGDAVEDGEGFDAVVSNPPYVRSCELTELTPDVRDHEPALALDGGDDGLAAYPTLLAAAARLLTPADGGRAAGGGAAGGLGAGGLGAGGLGAGGLAAEGLAAGGPTAGGLAAGRLVAVEVDPRRAAAVVELMRGAFPECVPRLERDLAGLERVVSAEGLGSRAAPPR